MSEKVLKVLSNVSQGLTETQKAQARSNIGCAGSYTAGTGITINDHSIINTAPNVKSDWNAATGTSAEILNKPSIGNGTLTIQKNGTSVATFSANQSGNATANITVPTDTSDLTNGAGFVTASSIPAQVNSDWNASSGVAEILNKPIVPDIKTVTTSLPPVETAVSSMTLFTDGRVRVNNSTDVGILAPTGTQTENGKVLVGSYVGSPGKFTATWGDVSTMVSNYPQIDFMGHVSYYVDLTQANYLYMEDGVAYDIMSNAGGSFTLHLMTNSTTTIHSKIYLWGDQANCMSGTIVYEDEGGEVSQLQYTYGDTSETTIYALDVFARKVHVSGSISFDTTMCRVYDYPCASRDAHSYNEDLGKVVEYIEPL